ncbi:hypothetical protein [Dictyobacter arantiisoli]|uniref:Uncharacterized protein n=1 Tax=Dictyobacter arantiisoli TaxID=2014874 RepID=A0A5A5T5D6_9CHLR|nr:hypothetical protein [Dictyobacter arantiisoli]GCF06611.1 hypothetical protein KDI_01750 [Dictyobacter arantiisoli]
MGIHVAITPTVLLLSILLVLLLAWMFVFAYLALRRDPHLDTAEREPVISSQPAAVKKSIPTQLAKLKPMTIQSSLSHKELSTRDAVLERSMR